MKTGQSTTSFHPATGNPIMTSTTYNRSVAFATDESKTEHSNESNGETLDSNKGVYDKPYPLRTRVVKDGRGRKGVWSRFILAINDLIPYKLRPIKSAGHRRGTRRWYGWRTAVLSWRINWRSIHKNRILNKLGLRHGSSNK
jgi:hypothetical protein